MTTDLAIVRALSLAPGGTDMTATTSTKRSRAPKPPVQDNAATGGAVKPAAPVKLTPNRKEQLKAAATSRASVWTPTALAVVRALNHESVDRAIDSEPGDVYYIVRATRLPDSGLRAVSIVARHASSLEQDNDPLPRVLVPVADAAITKEVARAASRGTVLSVNDGAAAKAIGLLRDVIDGDATRRADYRHETARSKATKASSARDAARLALDASPKSAKARAAYSKASANADQAAAALKLASARATTVSADRMNADGCITPVLSVALASTERTAHVTGLKAILADLASNKHKPAPEKPAK